MALTNCHALGTATGKVAGGGGIPYISYIGMCRPKGYGF